ncbi:MAG: hypothetical protein ACKV2T_26405 [Kofleriaceae bacterium]
MSALPMDYDVPGPSILDIVLDGGGGCFPQPANELPFGLPPLDSGWYDDDGWGEDDILGPGLPYDLFGEDNGFSSASAAAGFGIEGMLGGGGIGDAIGGGIFGGGVGGIGEALGGGIFGGGVGGIGEALGGGIFNGGVGGIGGAISGGIGGMFDMLF